MSASSSTHRIVKALGGLLLAIVALGLLLAFAAETIVAALEGEATTASLVAAAVALVLFLWCARTAWKLLGRRTSFKKD